MSMKMPASGKSSRNPSVRRTPPQPLGDAARPSLSNEASQTDRRDLPRKRVRLPAIVYAQGKAVQVVMRDASDRSMGFTSPRAFEVGEQVHIRVGIGPSRVPVAITITRCDREGEGFVVGATLV